jgi:ATF/CREB family transcription factor
VIKTLSKRAKKKRRSIESNTDDRKQQIRTSNRLAARRCRERRKNYIDTLEANIKSIETKQQNLMIENSQLHREINNLRAILNGHRNCNVTLNSDNKCDIPVLQDMNFTRDVTTIDLTNVNNNDDKIK